MSEVGVTSPVTVTLQAWEWCYLLGLVAATGAEGRTLDKLYGQVMEGADL
jgi:hypothetical protein